VGVDINHWIFVEAVTPEHALHAIREAAVDCPWAHEWVIISDLVGGDALDEPFVDASDAFLTNLERLTASVGARTPQRAAQATSALQEPLEDTSWLLLSSALAETTYGLWTPWSGGYDATEGTGLLHGALERTIHNPHQQWAALTNFNC
jgi:hypothetical protein